MNGTGVVTDLGRGSAIACGLGIAIGVGVPAFLPGAFLVCVLLLITDA